MTDLNELIKEIVKFRDERNWKQFHNPKDMAISLSLEAAEVLEHFQWKTPQEIEKHLKSNKEEVADELVDTLYWVLLMVHDFDVDLQKEFERKMKKNAKKYPLKKATSSHKKYTEL